MFDPEGAWNSASVLLVHGWTSEASFMTAFAEYFRKCGFRIVLFDFPAHGQSTRERASLIDCAHAVRHVAEALGPIEYVLADSLGGMAALLAGGGGAPMPRGYPFRAFVLVAMPNDFSAVTRTFGEEEALRPRRSAPTSCDSRRLLTARLRTSLASICSRRPSGQPCSCIHATIPTSPSPMPGRLRRRAPVPSSSLSRTSATADSLRSSCRASSRRVPLAPASRPHCHAGRLIVRRNSILLRCDFLHEETPSVALLLFSPPSIWSSTSEQACVLRIRLPRDGEGTQTHSRWRAVPSS